MPKTDRLWWGYVKQVIRAHPRLPEHSREANAVRAAMDETRALPDGETRLRVARAVLTYRTHTLHGAALAFCGGSYGDARRFYADFILLTAAKLGLH